MDERVAWDTTLVVRSRPRKPEYGCVAWMWWFGCDHVLAVVALRGIVYDALTQHMDGHHVRRRVINSVRFMQPTTSNRNLP